jgi:hypothetical protein
MAWSKLSIPFISNSKIFFVSLLSVFVEDSADEQK